MTFAFRPLELDDLELVRAYRSRAAIEVSELTFTNLFAWRKSMPAYLAESDGCLAVARATHGAAWLMPLPGDCDSGQIVPQLLSSDCDGMEILGMDRAPESVARELSESGLSIEPDRDNFDYVYLRQDLADLAGRKYHKKRNHIKKAIAEHDLKYREISGDLVDQCRSFMGHWCDTRQCGRVPGLCREFQAVSETLDNFEPLGVFGGAILVDGKVRGFTIGEELISGTAVVHFEKVDASIRGLGQVINQWFCRESLGDFEYVNREQDLGIPGLRQAKESYYPHHMVEKYRITQLGKTIPEVEEDKPVPCARSMG